MSTSIAPRLGVAEQEKQTIRQVGHDLRNNLSVMKNSVYYLNMKIGRQDSKLAKHIGILSKEISASSRTVASLMEFLAARQPSTVPTNIGDLLRQVLGRSPVPEGVRMEVRLPPELPMVPIDPRQLTCALENILAYRYAELRQGDWLWAMARANRRVDIAFVDSAPAPSEEELKHLFDIEPANGSYSLRLGLAAAHRLVELNRGYLVVESRPENGTRVGISLPVVT